MLVSVIYPDGTESFGLENTANGTYRINARTQLNYGIEAGAHFGKEGRWKLNVRATSTGFCLDGKCGTYEDEHARSLNSPVGLGLSHNVDNVVLTNTPGWKGWFISVGAAYRLFDIELN